ncbi:hypothetical protein BV898_14994 [Hypsibius exemplaris]|uniref:Uncharacterized protein n=1 Tax=Hypsibius exemplaris TaxID=2072580 RepID=A0A9X6RK07_HYPEX|nr:hypothetical protein BV898_14994 [Hypsibius exemplaris]
MEGAPQGVVGGSFFPHVGDRTVLVMIRVHLQEYGARWTLPHLRVATSKSSPSPNKPRPLSSLDVFGFRSGKPFVRRYLGRGVVSSTKLQCELHLRQRGAKTSHVIGAQSVQ